MKLPAGMLYMVRIKTEGLTKVFQSGSGKTVAVDSVDLTIEDGTFVTLLGPSGCGKTTLLRMLAGLETPSSGTILFDDDDVTDTSVQDRGISMVFQSIALLPFKTVRENIEYGLKYTDADKKERERKAKEMAELVGIGDLLKNKPNQLSGGQSQRVALSRALIRDPTVFLLDEPMSNLDAELKVDLRAELKELHSEFRETTLYVTHDQEEAMTLSEEVLVMKDGEIQQQSPPFELYTQPRTMFVARFIGSPNINFFSASVENGHLEVNDFDKSIEIPSDLRTKLEKEYDGEPLQIGIRPNKLELSNESESYLTAETTIYEQLGNETILHNVMSVGGEEQEIRAIVPPEITPDKGNRVHYTFDRSSVHIFNGTTGEAIVNSLVKGEESDLVGTV
jgi:multiple sugar transport system ATP-binding protein